MMKMDERMMTMILLDGDDDSEQNSLAERIAVWTSFFALCSSSSSKRHYLSLKNWMGLPSLCTIVKTLHKEILHMPQLITLSAFLFLWCIPRVFKS